jgi:hypothetical protein
LAAARPEAAVDVLVRSVRLGPELSAAWLQLGVACIKLDRLSDAEAIADYLRQSSRIGAKKPSALARAAGEACLAADERRANRPSVYDDIADWVGCVNGGDAQRSTRQIRPRRKRFRIIPGAAS